VDLYFIKLYVYIVTSSPFLFVFRNDRVTCDTWADDVPGEARDT